MELEAKFGFRSSFNFVPEGYETPKELRDELARNGFEVGVHGLKHDGKLYNSREIFRERAQRINHYLKEWKAVGFRSPFMHHNLEWIHDLNIQYDASTFDTDPFEPQPDGENTIFPFWVSRPGGGGYMELPYTLVQDFNLFMILQEKSIDVWKRKLDWIAEHGGMALLNTHPDYVHFGPGPAPEGEFCAELYAELLEYMKSQHLGQYWHALPREVGDYCRPFKPPKTSLSGKRI